MVRDPGPLHNLGFSVTSRDIPLNEGETEGDAPNSGFVARALNDHPIMRFLATSAATMVGTVVASKVTKKGGMKLAKTIQDKADNAAQLGEATFSTSIVKSVTEIRRHLDELQGVHRYIEGVDDPYSKMVFQQEGKLELTTGYEGKLSERRGFGFLTAKERRDAGSNFLSDEPPVVWSFKDELQQRLVRAGRRLPYELPAMYATQKAVIEPLTGERDESKPKVKWYNPVDVVADFTKSSLTNIATMVLPFEFAGAAASASRSSLHTLRYSMNDMRRLTPRQRTVQRGMRDMSELMAEVGQDFASLTNKFLKTASQASGSLATASDVYRNQGDFVQNLHSLRHGLKAARDAAGGNAAAKDDLRKTTFKTLFKGYEDPVTRERSKSIFELSSAFRGIPKAVEAGVDDFKLLGRAYDAMESSVAFNQQLLNRQGVPVIDPDRLKTAMERIRSQHSSRVTSFAAGVRRLGGGGPDSGTFNQSEFFYGQQEDAFKGLFESQLVSNGVDRAQAAKFINNAKFSLPRVGTDPTNILTIGKRKIMAEGDEFFEQVIQRYKGIKGGEEFADAIQANTLRRSIEDARNVFTSADFQRTTRAQIASNWNTVENQNLLKIGEGILSPKKSNFIDFLDPGDSFAKQDFLRRKTAQSVGVRLTNVDGVTRPDSEIVSELGKRGFDASNFTDLRSFLIRNRKMSANLSGSGFNMFGMQALTVQEAMESGRFSHLRQEEQDIIQNLAKRRSFSDPASSPLTLSKLDGVYKTRSGDVLDFTAVKSAASRFGDFLASEFKIPVLGFNPADLLGYRSMSEMRKSSPLQYVSSRTVQPFIGDAADNAEFFIFSRTKGSKGKLVSFGRDSSGALSGDTLQGTFRGLPTASTDLFTRHARFASGEEGLTPEQIRGASNNRVLNATLGEQRAVSVKRRMSVDTDQPNSLIGAAKRFLGRKKDTGNPSIIARMLRDDDITDFGPALLDDINQFRKESFKYGMPAEVMEYLEKNMPQFFKAYGRGASEIKSPQQAMDLFDELLAGVPNMARQVRQSGGDPKELYTSISRLRRMANEASLMSSSSMSQHSPTISSRLDQFRNEIFKYIAQSNQMVASPSGNDIFTDMVAAIQALHKRGVISSAQKTEAQAAGLSILFNFSAFKTFSDKNSALQNAKSAAEQLMSLRKGAESLFDPFAEGSISQISSTMRRKFSPLLGPLNKKLGYARFDPDDLSIDPLGSGQATTIVPTFGTVFGTNPFAAISSALGLNTYKNQKGFSTGSIPISQGVERLNRYFGSVGMQLDVSDFSGPLDLFARGMVGKRVLPIYAAGATALTVDRTMGGMVNGEDERGERIYSPLVLGGLARGAVEMQAAAAGVTPGGMSYEEKREQLLEGEVAIRQGRFWPLGSQPFRGGKTMYYRPSWYRRLEGAATYTSDTYGSPMEKFLFYNDISPLRPLDPYRFERKHYDTRPYPMTGEYFSGPFGPLVPLANATIGKVLKPQLAMHEEEVATGLAAYTPAGEFGAYDPTAYQVPARPIIGVGGMEIPVGRAPAVGAVSFGGAGAGGYSSPIASMNAEMSSRAGATNMAQSMVQGGLGNVNAQYASAAYGPPKTSGIMNPRIVAAGQPLESGSTQFQLSELGYKSQEMLGIYGFAFGSLRQGLGFGQSDFEPQRAVLQSASKAYGTSRAFWDLNLGGLGDVPLPSQDAVGNIEFSEIVRRFIPKERSGVDYLNPIQNLMGQQYSWLPGPEYYNDFTRGDPFTKVQEGELRLPGVGYERFNQLYPDETGQYGLINQLDILGDIAPYSQQYKTINSQVNKMNLSPDEKIKVSDIRAQVEDVTSKYDFKDYKYRGTTPEEMGMNPLVHTMARAGEYMAHSDNFVMNKIAGHRTAIEDWERTSVYGSTFPEWQRPFESYIQPMLNKATQENPITAAASLGIIGGMFGRTPKAKLFGSALGISAGLASSITGQVSELITGDRFIPEKRKKELALEEYSDIMTYVKNASLAQQAKAQGDSRAAAQFASAAGRTMYGMDLTRLQDPEANLDMISLAVPKRKREHFRAMIDAPVEDRERILSTAGRLERRMYQAAWGMKVEERPDLVDYFSRHELPDQNWEGWSANTNNDHIKIKMGQSMGLEMSQMGYYPQQIKEANLSNPSYPDFFAKQDRGDVTERLRRLMTGLGVQGSVMPVANPFGNQQVNVYAGV